MYLTVGAFGSSPTLSTRSMPPVTLSTSVSWTVPDNQLRTYRYSTMKPKRLSIGLAVVHAACFARLNDNDRVLSSLKMWLFYLLRIASLYRLSDNVTGLSNLVLVCFGAAVMWRQRIPAWHSAWARFFRIATHSFQKSRHACSQNTNPIQKSRNLCTQYSE